MTETEASVRRLLETLWSIKREKADAAQEKRLRDTIALDNDRIRWQHYQSIVSRNGARCEYEHTEIV